MKIAQIVCILAIVIILSSPTVLGQLKSGSQDIKTSSSALHSLPDEENYTDHSPIKIDNDTDFKNTAELEDWKGNGSQGSPFVIEGISIAGYYDYGIYIGNTTVHFKIKNTLILVTPNITSWWLNVVGSGIYLENVENGNITDNDIVNSVYGIYLNNCVNTSLYNNDVRDNSDEGMIISHSISIVIKENSLKNNTIFLLGDRSCYWDTHTIPNTNKINNKKIIYWKDRKGGKLQGKIGQVILANCTGIRINDATLRRIEVGFCSNNTFVNITVKDKYHPDPWFSVFFIYSSTGNTLIDNTVKSSRMGVFLRNSTGNRILKLTALHNTYAIVLYNSDNNNIIHNYLKYDYCGIGLKGSNHNTLAKNTINNKTRGIELNKSKSNRIYLNNFMNNEQQVYLANGSQGENHWNNSAGKGNYWSDYEGEDDGSNGRADGDGVGDTQIPHPETDHGEGYYHLDNYPLMDIWVPEHKSSRPRNLQASLAEGQVNLFWDVPSHTSGNNITEYKIYRGTSSGNLTLHDSVDGNTTSFTDTEVTNDQTYYYKVSAVTSAGEGNKTIEVSATPTADDDDGGTPGFTTMVLLSATVVALAIYYQKKRWRS